MITAARCALTLIARFSGKTSFSFDCVLDYLNLERMENYQNRAVLTAKKPRAIATARCVLSMAIIAICAIWLGIKNDFAGTVGVGIIKSGNWAGLGSCGG